ncbi:MAG TPA: hypothetical protein PKC28_04995 [Bdellovibrionales bacterium]|nr:hypothetical protein [Bdellovibrionales bacterium]
MIKLLLASILSSHGAILFIDMNKYTKKNLEQAACIRGAKASGDKYMGYLTIGPGEDAKEKIKMYVAAEMRRKPGLNYDSIIITGEDGTGHFFGDAGGDLYADQIQEAIAETPELQTVEAAGTFGCYPNTWNGAEQYWLKPNPNIQFTMGFTGKGPANFRPASAELIEQFCRERRKGIQAAKQGQLCEFSRTIEKNHDTSWGVCGRDQIVSPMYREKGQDKECFTYAELKRRCPEFEADQKWRDSFAAYMDGAADPVTDESGEDSKVRAIYNRVELWRECANQPEFSHLQKEIPDAATLLRLIKFDKIKKNMGKVYKNEIADYDEKLRQLGMEDLALGDLNMERGEIINRVYRAITKLQNMPKKANGLETKRVHRMAQCMRQTLVNLDIQCVEWRMTDIGENAPAPEAGACMRSYDRSQGRLDDHCKGAQMGDPGAY